MLFCLLTHLINKTLPAWLPLLSEIYFFNILFIYERQREREAQRHRQREKQTPCREPDAGLDPQSPGSGPGLKAALNHWATLAALNKIFFKRKQTHHLGFSFPDIFSYLPLISLHGPVHWDAKKSPNHKSFSMFTYPLYSHLAFQLFFSQIYYSWCKCYIFKLNI